MDRTYHWDIFHEKDGSIQLIDRHLNFDISYDVQEQTIVTGKSYKFHVDQIHPSVAICNDGKCGHLLCQPTGKEFKSASDAMIRMSTYRTTSSESS